VVLLGTGTLNIDPSHSKTELLQEIKDRYDGKVVSGNDLDIF
jgi:hypothetical protein